MKRSDTFVQYKSRHTIIFMKVLKVEEMIGDREVCKVCWCMLDGEGLNIQSN